MPVWNTTPVTETPKLRLRNWCVFESSTGERHLAGFNLSEDEGRVSSALQSVEPASRCATTATGRLYELVGLPGLESDGRYVLQRWLALNEEPQPRDVTAEVWLAIRSVLPDVNDGLEGPPGSSRSAGG